MGASREDLPAQAALGVEASQPLVPLLQPRLDLEASDRPTLRRANALHRAPGEVGASCQGPSLVGRGNPVSSTLFHVALFLIPFPQYLGHHNRMAYGNFGPQGSGSFGFSPNYQYRWKWKWTCFAI